MCHTQMLSRESTLFMRPNKENTLGHGTQSNSIGSQPSRSFLETNPPSALMSGSPTINPPGNSPKPDPDPREPISPPILVIAQIIKKSDCARLLTFITENLSMSSQPNSEWAKRSECRQCTNRETGCLCILSVIRYTRPQSINLTSSKMVDSLSDQRTNEK